MYGNKIASQNLFTSLKIWRTILNASALCACMHHHQDQWITAAAGLNMMIAQQPHTSSRAREHGADVCHASLVMQVMCVWTVKKCHGFMWKQTLVASDRKSRHPLHPPTSDSWLLCPWVLITADPTGRAISVILWLWLHGGEEKPNTGPKKWSTWWRLVM